MKKTDNQSTESVDSGEIYILTNNWVRSSQCHCCLVFNPLYASDS